MTRTGFFTLCAATAVILAFTVYTVIRQPAVRAADSAGALLFPGLTERLNGLKSVAIRTGNGELTFDWDGKIWTSRERNGYPADSVKIAALIVQMAQMTKIEPKTRSAEKYDRLDLEDPTKKDSHGKEVALFDSGGKVLADIIVGKRKFTLGSKEGGVYVRIPGDPQTWLALGDLNPGLKPGDWLMREIANIPDTAIRRVSVTHADGEKLVLEKSSPTDTAFKIANLPRGKQASSDYAGNELGHVLSDLLLDDVAKAGSIDFPREKTTVAEFDGFQGLHVVVETTESAGNTWLRIHATADAPSDSGADKSAVNDWSKTAAAITARSTNWVYRVPSYEVSSLNKRMSDLVKKPEKGAKS
ncbi:MAG: DUF4340 domain-containing protein [Rhodospirillaceae bacterium]|nr:MAG: DUF4340 domain-containing protein [Rhodospirillaceae bacterium]